MEPKIIYNQFINGKRHITVQPVGVCSRQIDILLAGDTIEEVQYFGGCMGNTQGLGALLRGMKVADAIERLSGIDCNFKGTSCPDQLAQALVMVTSGVGK